MTGVPRQNTTQQVDYFRRRVNFNTAGVSGGVYLGTLPAGAIVVSALVRINTPFNAGDSNLLTVGSNSTDYDNIVGPAEVAEGTAGGYASNAITVAGNVFTVNTDLFVQYKQTGTAATAGQADVVLQYVPDNDQ